LDANLLSFPLVLLLALLPGALVAFGLPCPGLSWPNRVLLGTALSPCVVAVGFTLLQGAGASFELSARVIFVAAFVSGPLMARRMLREPPRLTELVPLLALGLVLGAFAALLVDVWQGMGAERYFIHHGLHHSDIIYSAGRQGVVPDNPLFAGESLRYPFFAHYFWAWAAWLQGRNPLLLWQQTTLVWLGLTGLLFYATARALGLRPWFSVLAVILLFSGCNAVGSMWDVVQGRLSMDLGDARYGSFLHKYMSFNVMPFALALLSGVIFVCASILRGAGSRSWLALLATLLAGIAIVYPILFPVGFASAAAILLIPLLGTGDSASSSQPKEQIGLLLLAALVFALSMSLLAGRTGGTPLAPSDLAHAALKTGQVAVALGPLLLVALPELVQGLRGRDPGTLLLASVTLAGAGFFVAAQLPAGNEYKGIYFASMGAALLAARSLDLRLRLGTPAALGLVIVLLVGTLALNAMRLDLVPTPTLTTRFDLGAHRLALAKSEPASRWIEAVRERTPADTVLIAPPSPLPLATLAARDEYIGLWQSRQMRPGYGVSPREWIVQALGARPLEFDRREAVHSRIYAQSADAGDSAELIEALRALGRPVAIYFPTRANAFLAELRRQALGRAVFSRAGQVVWLIDFEQGSDAPSPASRSHTP